MTKIHDFSVLLVDDEAAWLRSFKLMLMRTTPIGNVMTCQDSRQVIDIMATNKVDLILLDLTMPHLRGEDLLMQLRTKYPEVLVIVITGMNTVDTAVQCIKNGAFDYYVKTWGEERLSKEIIHAIRVIDLERMSHKINQAMLKKDLTHPDAFSSIITASQDMQYLFSYIEAIASSHHPVLITGESGVGKELIARAIYTVSGVTGDFVSVNMASLDDFMLEDTLFGHSRGAFTNAHQGREGLTEQAKNGVLFMDEIGELSPSSQAKLLRFLQEEEYYPIGSDKPKQVQTRIVLATNQDLISRMEDGSFRADLYYRLKAHHIHVPSLRERKEDVPLLTRYFIEQTAQEFGHKVPQVSGELLLMLTKYNYPGNVRELQAMITHAVSFGRECLSQGDFEILSAFPPEEKRGFDDEHAILNFLLQLEKIPSFIDMKKIMTTAALSKAGGKQTEAARILGISQPAMSKRMRN